MIIYNQTSNVHSSLQLEWCKWMQYTYLPSLIQKGLFSKLYAIVRPQRHGQNNNIYPIGLSNLVS